MLQEWKPDLLTRLYVYSLCLLVYAAGDVSWLLSVPRTPLYIIVSFIAIIKIARDGVNSSPKKTILILLWLTFNVIIIFVFRGSFISHFFRLVYFMIMASVIWLSFDEMKYLLKILTNCFIIILIVSIPAWILYLMGVPLAYTGPHYHENGYHVYYDYYYFTTQVNTGLSDYYRFSSVFLEPGQMATPCAFLFHLNSKENKIFQFKNVIMIIAIVMSFSLIAYGLLLTSLVVNRMEGKYRIPALVVTLLVIVGLGQYFISHEDNAVNALIVSRLEYSEETTISGYNRTNDYFEARYDELMQSQDKYFGIHNQSLDWTKNTSGYKKFIVKQGIVGFAIVMGMMLVLWWDNRNRSALIYGIMVVISFLVRDMLTTPLWLTCAIIGMYVLGADSKKVEYSNQVITKTI